MVLLDTGTPDTSREMFSEDAHGGTRTRILTSRENCYQVVVVTLLWTQKIKLGAKYSKKNEK